MGAAHELGSAAMSAAEFFEKLPSRVVPEKTAGMNNSYVFAIDGAGTWTVRVADGAVTVDEGDTGGDCTISTSAEVFEKIIAAPMSPLIFSFPDM